MNKIHQELKTAIKNRDYGKICQFLHTNHYESDSQHTVQRTNDSFCQGWQEAERLLLKASQEPNKEMLGVVEFYGDELNQIAPIYKPTGKPGADFTQPYRMDKGKRARQFLAKHKDLIGGAE